MNHFCPFTQLTTEKTKIFKKGKKLWRYYHFTHVCDKRQNFLSFWTLFFQFYPLNNPKNQNFEEMKKEIHLEKLPFYTCVPYMKIIWCMVPEIWSAMDRIFCNFRSFFALLPQQQPQKRNILKKWKNTWGYYHFTHVYHKWSHIMYGSWDMEHDGHNFLSFWTIFCTFIPLTIRKIKILKKGKKPWRYYLFTHVYDKWQSNDLWFLRYGVRWTEFMSCCAMTEFMSWIYVMLHKCTKNYDQMIVC